MKLFTGALENYFLRWQKQLIFLSHCKNYLTASRLFFIPFAIIVQWIVELQDDQIAEENARDSTHISAIHLLYSILKRAICYCLQLVIVDNLTSYI